MSSDPTISVVMTCYNEGPYIGAAVQSILDQTRGDLVRRIVIADDGSDPATVAVLRQIEAMDPRIQVLYGPGGGGLARRRNDAIEHVDTPWFAILDGDDLWTKDRVESALPVIARGGVDLVYADFLVFSGHDLEGAYRAGVSDITGASDLTRTYFLKDAPIVPSVTLLRTEAFRAAGAFDPGVRIFEDTDLFIRMARRGRFGFVARPLAYKRVRSNSLSAARSELLAHHAFVAFRAAAEEPRLLALVPKRLSERARKLGNQQVLAGSAEARQMLRAAIRLDPLNWKAWASLASALVPRLTTSLQKVKEGARRPGEKGHRA